MTRCARVFLVALASATQATAQTTAQTPLERYQSSLFTVEVHSGNQSARAAQGSGYVVPGDARVVTNYHVVSSFVRYPDRYRIRVRNAEGEHQARLLRFDLVNDLALLHVPGLEAAALEVATSEPPAGSPVLSFGNPHGFGISQIDGTHNGRADKGLVPRMLLSMPLNAGMSGGPILDAAGHVVGTNVAVVWLENSLSFGVPADKLKAMLEAAPLEITPEALQQETTRQLLEIERTTATALLEAFGASRDDEPITVGGVRAVRPPEVFECWDHVQDHSAEGITKSQYGCNLQFTPSLEDLGPVASVQLAVEHFTSRDSRYGFYGWLGGHAAGHHSVYPIAPRDPNFTPPECVGERVQAARMRFRVETCVSAYVRHPGLFEASFVATSLDRPQEVAFVSLDVSGVRLETLLALSRVLLDGIRFAESP